MMWRDSDTEISSWFLTRDSFGKSIDRNRCFHPNKPYGGTLSVGNIRASQLSTRYPLDKHWGRRSVFKPAVLAKVVYFNPVQDC